MNINPQLKNAMQMRRINRNLSNMLGSASHKRCYFNIGYWTSSARITIRHLKSTR